jgi:hypothetical protein
MGRQDIEMNYTKTTQSDCNEPNAMSTYDNLPPNLRKYLQDNPYRLHPGPIRDALKIFTPIELESILRDRMRLIVRDSAKLIYGPDHPQAQ